MIKDWRVCEERLDNGLQYCILLLLVNRGELRRSIWKNAVSAESSFWIHKKMHFPPNFCTTDYLIWKIITLTIIFWRKKVKIRKISDTVFFRGVAELSPEELLFWGVVVAGAVVAIGVSFGNYLLLGQSSLWSILSPEQVSPELLLEQLSRNICHWSNYRRSIYRRR